MYRVTYIKLMPGGPHLVTISHPNLAAAMTVYDALKIAGVHARLWDRNSTLYMG